MHSLFDVLTMQYECKSEKTRHTRKKRLNNSELAEREPFALFAYLLAIDVEGKNVNASAK